MGEPLRIVDLRAASMVRLPVLPTSADANHPDGDISIQYHGPTTGESFYEELLIGDLRFVPPPIR